MTKNEKTLMNGEKSQKLCDYKSQKGISCSSRQPPLLICPVKKNSIIHVFFFVYYLFDVVVRKKMKSESCIVFE